MALRAKRPAPASARPASEVPLPEEILAHPRFPASRAAFVDAILQTYADASIIPLLTEIGRNITYFTILSLHAAFDETDRATWPTKRLLREEMQIYGVASERRVADVVARLVAAGYVETRTVDADRRLRILVPTAKMVAHDLDWLVAHFAPLDVMFPDPGYALPMSRDPSYRIAHRRRGRRMSESATRLLASNPPILFFLGRDAGAMILIELIQREREGGGSRRVCFTDIGVRFGVSRTHVRETLREADRAGLVQLSGRDAILLPPVLAAFDRFVADCMSAHDLMFREITRGDAAPDGPAT